MKLGKVKALLLPMIVAASLAGCSEAPYDSRVSYSERYADQVEAVLDGSHILYVPTEQFEGTLFSNDTVRGLEVFSMRAPGFTNPQRSLHDMERQLGYVAKAKTEIEANPALDAEMKATLLADLEGAAEYQRKSMTIMSSLNTNPDLKAKIAEVAKTELAELNKQTSNLAEFDNALKTANQTYIDAKQASADIDKSNKVLIKDGTEILQSYVVKFEAPVRKNRLKYHMSTGVLNDSKQQCVHGDERWATELGGFCYRTYLENSLRYNQEYFSKEQLATIKNAIKEVEQNLRAGSHKQAIAIVNANRSKAALKKAELIAENKYGSRYALERAIRNAQSKVSKATGRASKDGSVAEYKSTRHMPVLIKNFYFEALAKQNLDKPYELKEFSVENGIKTLDKLAKLTDAKAVQIEVTDEGKFTSYAENGSKPQPGKYYLMDKESKLHDLRPLNKQNEEQKALFSLNHGGSEPINSLSEYMVKFIASRQYGDSKKLYEAYESQNKG